VTTQQDGLTVARGAWSLFSCPSLYFNSTSLLLFAETPDTSTAASVRHRDGAGSLESLEPDFSSARQNSPIKSWPRKAAVTCWVSIRFCKAVPIKPRTW